jgi:transposase
MRCLKRRLSDIVYRTMLDDRVATKATNAETSPGGHRGNGSNSSAAGSHPHTTLFARIARGARLVWPRGRPLVSAALGTPVVAPGSALWAAPTTARWWWSWC